MEEIAKYQTEITRTPELIAVEINIIKNQTRRMMLYNSIEIGRKLIEAKQMLEHGEWGNWLEEKVDYSQRTANNLMRIFEEYGSTQITLLEDNSNSQALANLSYTQAVALLGIPEEEREAFAEDNNIENLSTRELQKLIKEKEEAKEEVAILSEDVRILEKQKNKAEKAEDIARKELENYKENLKKERDKAEREQGYLTSNIESLKKELEEAKAKEETITAAVIEKVPEEIETELAELRNKVNANRTEIKFNIHFDTLVKDFKELLETVINIEKENNEMAEKYKKATKTLIEKMIDRIS